MQLNSKHDTDLLGFFRLYPGLRTFVGRLIISYCKPPEPPANYMFPPKTVRRHGTTIIPPNPGPDLNLDPNSNPNSAQDELDAIMRQLFDLTPTITLILTLLATLTLTLTLNRQLFP